MNILAIETSCDETAMAYVEALDGPIFTVHAECVASQIDIHRPFGGVVPNLAKREHIKNLPIVFEEITNQLKVKSYPLVPDRIAVTVGPGLEPALWTGINFATELGKKMGVQVVGINHMEGHLFSNWLKPAQEIQFPAIALIVSGGHTMLMHMESLKSWNLLGETRDDAAGEAFDKVARLLNLPYPGGPEIEKCSLYGSSTLIEFPRPMLHSGDYDFSFSGLKTAVVYYLREVKSKNQEIGAEDVCASFQAAVTDVLVQKTMRAAREYGARSVLIAGGVASNDIIASALKTAADGEGISFYRPPKAYNTDNAVMIAAAAFLGRHYPSNTATGSLSL